MTLLRCCLILTEKTVRVQSVAGRRLRLQPAQRDIQRITLVLRIVLRRILDGYPASLSSQAGLRLVL